MKKRLKDTMYYYLAAESGELSRFEKVMMVVLGGGLGGWAGILLGIILTILIYLLIFLPLVSVGLFIDIWLMYHDINMICICIGAATGCLVEYKRIYRDH